MTTSGLERVKSAFAGIEANRPPILPILHSGLPPIFGIPAGKFFTSAETMADVIVRGYRKFGYDGVQLSLGVTGEAEALGARVEQPEDGAPVLKETLLPDLQNPDALRARDPTTGGRIPLYFEAVQRVVESIGDEAFVLSILRGPLLMASQLCGVEELLIAMLTQPEAVSEVLAFTSEVALKVGTWLIDSGAHGLSIGEATCSPNFISPKLYRDMVLPHHTTLVRQLKQAGWETVGLHICGNIVAIVEDIIATGVDFMDVDYQVPADVAIQLVKNRVALRGNLDPSAVFRFGTPEQVQTATHDLCQTAGHHPKWIMSSGCDIPPGTPASNITTFVQTIKAGDDL